MKLIEVQPIRYTSSQAFVERADSSSGLETMQVPVYPHSLKGRELQKRRLDNHVNLRDLGRLVGIKPSEVCGLETGHYTLSEMDWADLFKAIDSIS